MLLLATLLTTPGAWAAGCDSLVGRIGSLTAENVVSGFNDLAKCDAKLADANFNRFLEKATDSDTLVNLALAAVDQNVWNPMWLAIGKIQSYDARSEVTTRVGEACSEHTKVIPFLQGAYIGLRQVDFQQWTGAFISCNDAKLHDWEAVEVKKTPKGAYDEKYDSLLTIYVRSMKADALPALTEAAIKAGKEDGPFDGILAKMGDAVAGDMGASATPENQKKLEDALVAIAKAVPPKLAHNVANQLASSGSDAAAASLLPAVYPDRVQSGGGFLYGAASVEMGDCGGKKTAVIHYATVTEPGRRWTILGDIEGPMRAFKPKLKGCTVDSPWAVIQSPEPVKSANDAQDWIDGVVKDWSEAHKDYKVSVQKEKAVAL